MTHSKPITTTLERIKACKPCEEQYKKLLEGLGKTKADDEPLPYAKILEINGLGYALWCLRAEPQHSNLWRLMAVRFAREVQHLMKDQRSINALDVAERHATGQATDEELEAARVAAVEAWAATRSLAAQAAAWAVSAWAWVTSWAWAAEAAAYAVAAVVEAGAWSSEVRSDAALARDAATAKQTAIFLDIVGGGSDSQR